MKTPVPVPSPSSLERIHKADVFLGDLGHRIGLWLSHPHMVTVSSAHVHIAPHLALATFPIALGAAALPAGMWLKGHHDSLGMRLGGLDPRVRQEMWRWNRMTDKVFPAKPGFMGEKQIVQKAIGGRRTRSGVTLLIHFDNRGSTDGLGNEKVLAAVSASMRCPVQIERIYMRPHRCLARLQRRDTLAKTAPWPWLDRYETDFFGPIPVAYDIDGKTVTLDLREQCILVGGSTGAGKSWWVHTIVAAAMLDKRVRVHILDGKRGVGFDVWESAADSFATNDIADIEHAYKVIVRLEGMVDRIYDKLRAQGKRTIDWGTAEHVDLLVLDEFTAFLGYKDIHKRLLHLIARGRAAGLMMILTTQRPSSKVIDTDFRELFHLRAAFWSDRNGSKMILGDGVQVDSSEFSGLYPGEMWLLTEGKKPVHCRGFELTDSDLANLADRARVLRAIDAAPTDSVPNDTAHNDPQNAADTAPTSVAPKLELISSAAPKAETPTVRLTGTEAACKLRDLLEAIAELGPEVTGPALRTALQVGSDVISVRGRKLLDAGYVQNSRKAPSGSPSGGSRDPLVWSILPLGREALAASDASRNDPVAQPREAGAQ